MASVKSKAFTLVELMIVVAIIGILAAVSIPGFQKYIVKSKLAEISVTYGTFNKAQLTYKVENGAFVARSSPTGGSGILGDDPANQLQTVLNGGKFPAGSADTSVNKILGFPLSPDTQIGYYMAINGGGYNDTTGAVYGSPDAGADKILTSNPAAGTSCNSTYYENTPQDLGVRTDGSDQSIDWYMLVAVANISYPDSEKCVNVIQYTTVQGTNPHRISPLIELK